ncbi:MAG: argininosuccinate lyase [Proteobacteria bacterium]|nr:argininosuccinate lyase [Pseudomonadota bacterium]
MANKAEVSIRERLKKPPSAVFVETYFGAKVEKDLKYNFDAEMEIHLAHGLMLANQKIVSAADLKKILKLVLQIQAKGPGILDIDFKLEGLYSYTERYIVSKLGPEVGGRLHTGRSRNDMHTTAWRMALRKHMLENLTLLVALRSTVLKLAQKHAATVMPGYTHSQHAQPITLGYYLLTVGDLLARDFTRLFASLQHTDQCPLGAGALTTTAFPLDRKYVAKALGFAKPMEIAYDAVSNRDDAMEATAALSIMMTNISRLAFDLQAWNTFEYQFIETGDEHSSVSSIMPQKKNPAALEHIKAVAAMVGGAFSATSACVKNTSLSDVADGVTALNGPTLDACAHTRNVLLLLEEVLAAITVNKDVMLRSAEIGFGSATELSDVIVRETGLSFRMAHNVVGTVVRKTVAQGGIATDITAADIDEAAVELFGKALGMSAQAVAEALDPAKNIEVREMLGGPGPKQMRSMIKARKAGLQRDASAVNATARRVVKAREKLFADTKTFCK